MSLRAAREAARRMTQTELAQASGVAQSTISDIEVRQARDEEPDVLLSTARDLLRTLQKRGLKKLTLDDLFPEAR